MSEIQILKPNVEKIATKLDALWLLGSKYFLHQKASWSGYMSQVVYDIEFTTSNIMPLPFINLDPSNPNTIYTALLFAAEKCHKYNKPCIVTFDQPLFLKAVDIVEGSNSESILSKVIVRLGGFHTLMSFMGSIGNIMSGSGIEELWQTIYAKNTVPHMLSGHAYARALRCHFLTQEALALLLLHDVALTGEDIEEICNLFEQPLPNNVESNHLVEDAIKKIELRISELSKSSRTARLWCNYYNLINIIKMFIRAERSGNWDLHIYCLKLMIPIFYATGHNNYAKCTHLYLQQINKLHNMSSENYEKFVTDGMFTVRRTNNFWSGTWTDMVIEQNLMRSIKTTGGLTHGRGFTDSSLARWIAGMSVCMPVTTAMEDFLECKSVSSEQHMELSRSRQQRDKTDLSKILDWLDEYNPFKCQEFTSVFSGRIATPDINCDLADEIGKTILTKNIGKLFTDIKCKRTEQIKNFSQMSNNIKINKNYVNVSPMQLFNRIICSNKTPDEIRECFRFELSPYPLSLFKDGVLRKGTKSLLFKEFDVLATPISSTGTGQNATYVVDGGFLLHKVVWQKPATFQQICEQYINYAKYFYGEDCVVVFDGYNSKSFSTKDALQQLRSKNSQEISVKLENTIVTPQEDFLRNNNNKQKLIELLKISFEKTGIKIKQAESDADFLIVNTAVTLPDCDKKIVVVSEDTDIAVLLIHHSKHKNMFLLRPGKAAKPDKLTNIFELQDKLGDVKKHILFAHAISGCDTTSFIFKKSKALCIKLLKKDISLCQRLQIFYEENPDKKQLMEVGITFITKLYRTRNSKEGIDSLRFTLYNRITCRQGLSANFNLAVLPPTKDAAIQHIFRAYYQVSYLLLLSLNNESFITFLGTGVVRMQVRSIKLRMETR